MQQISKTDLTTAVRYLEDAARIYEALSALPMQKCTCRAHMIRQLISKLNRLKNDQTRHH